MNLGDSTIIQDIEIQDQPIGCNYNAPLPNGVANIRARPVLGAARTGSPGRWQLTSTLKASGGHRRRSPPSPFD
eukprot:1027605-Pyramimonas_sp.AAC.1